MQMLNVIWAATQKVADWPYPFCGSTSDYNEVTWGAVSKNIYSYGTFVKPGADL